MSKITLAPDVSGSGTFTIAAPDSNTDRTLNLPDVTTTLVGTDATQTLTNKTIQGGALTLATAVTASGTSVDFTGIPSWVKRITVMFAGVSLSGTSQFLVQLGDSGGVETTGYISASAVARNASSTIGGNSTSGFIVYQGTSAANVFSGAARFDYVGSNLWCGSIVGSLVDASGISGGGNKTLSDTLTQVRITTVNGTDTFDAGTINIMYEG